jgi:hypothetical protein
MRTRKDPDNNNYWFFCPGCNNLHHIPVKDGVRDGWQFTNGNKAMPSFYPSIDRKTGHYVQTPPQPQPPDCDICNDCTERGKVKSTCGRCHSVITDGRISYQADSTHHLAGQTVDLPELPEDFLT